MKNKSLKFKKFKKYKKIWIRFRLYSRRTFWKFLYYYKRVIVKKNFWKINLFKLKFFKANFYNYKFRTLVFKTNLVHRKKSLYYFKRRLKYYTSYQKLWWNTLVILKFYHLMSTRWALFSSRRSLYYPTARVRQFPSFRMVKILKKKKWQKLRKRWLWHRLIKNSVRVRFLSNIKKYFAYNIAVRKFFKQQIYKFALYKNSFYQRLPAFLLQKKLVPMISKGEWLCNSKKILINSKAVNNRYIMKPYDLVTFLFRKSLIRAKQYRFFYKKQNKGSKLKIRKGLIHNKQCNFFILYKNINFMRRSKSKYLFYYYFYRNLLQTCRMR